MSSYTGAGGITTTAADPEPMTSETPVIKLPSGTPSFPLREGEAPGVDGGLRQDKTGLSRTEEALLLSGLKAMEADMCAKECREHGGILPAGSPASHATAAFQKAASAIAYEQIQSGRDDVPEEVMGCVAKAQDYDAVAIMRTLRKAHDHAARVEAQHHGGSIVPGGIANRLKVAEEHLVAAVEATCGPDLGIANLGPDREAPELGTAERAP